MGIKIETKIFELENYLNGLSPIDYIKSENVSEESIKYLLQHPEGFYGFVLQSESRKAEFIINDIQRVLKNTVLKTEMQTIVEMALYHVKRAIPRFEYLVHKDTCIINSDSKKPYVKIVEPNRITSEIGIIENLAKCLQLDSDIIQVTSDDIGTPLDSDGNPAMLIHVQSSFDGTQLNRIATLRKDIKRERAKLITYFEFLVFFLGLWSRHRFSKEFCYKTDAKKITYIKNSLRDSSRNMI